MRICYIIIYCITGNSTGHHASNVELIPLDKFSFNLDHGKDMYTLKDIFLEWLECHCFVLFLCVNLTFLTCLTLRDKLNIHVHTSLSSQYDCVPLQSQDLDFHLQMLLSLIVFNALSSEMVLFVLLILRY